MARIASTRLHFRHASAWLLTVLMLVQFPGAIALVFGGIAWLDGEHRVAISTTANGNEVFLKHDQEAPVDSDFSECHEHCVVSQFLVAFEAPHSVHQSDHVLKFPAVSATSLKGSRVSLAKPAPGSTVGLGLLPDSIAAAACTFRTTGRPPPSSIEACFIRQIVLLI